MQVKSYAVKNKDEVVISKSRSGGIFTAVSDEVLENGGVVYGCVLDSDFFAKHIRATTKDERNLMRGSKYIQSIIGDCYKQAKADLENGLLVLFTGTSCQIDGLKKFLMRDYDNLLCLDILCHGVPSPVIWKDYLSWVSKKLKAPVKSVNFRNKEKFGWNTHYETITGINGEEFDSRVFIQISYGENIVRPSCYECKYSNIHHPSDITIGDYWGIDKACPEFNDNKGVSLVLINTEKGDVFFDKIKSRINFAETKLEDSMQPVLIEPFGRLDTRDGFWKNYNKHSFNYIAYKYGGYGKINAIKKKIGYKVLAVKRKIGWSK